MIIPDFQRMRNEFLKHDLRTKKKGGGNGILSIDSQYVKDVVFLFRQHKNLSKKEIESSLVMLVLGKLGT